MAQLALARKKAAEEAAGTQYEWLLENSNIGKINRIHVSLHFGISISLTSNHTVLVPRPIKAVLQSWR